MLQRDEGTCRWRHTKRLYRSWGNIKACLTSFTITVAICFLLITIGCGFVDGFSLNLLSTQSKIWGCVLLGACLLAIPSYYLWAWAQGGVDDWEYKMDDHGIEGHKIVHHAGRMKVLRAFAWILMFAPARPGQKLAMRNLLYDNTKKEVTVRFGSVQSVSGDAAKDTIVFQFKGDPNEIDVPCEDYAEIFSFIQAHIRKPKKRRSR